jgi:hypothetical protein
MGSNTHSAVIAIYRGREVGWKVGIEDAKLFSASILKPFIIA